MKMSLRLYGDWEKTKRIFRKKKERARKNYGPREQALLKLGNAIKAKVREHIFSQDLGWVPLKESTVRRKGGSIIYFDKGTYIRNIKVTLRKGKHGTGSTTLMVGPYGKHKRIDMRKLASILEYGNSHIQARPIWRPTMLEVKKMKEYDELIETLMSLKDD